MSYLALARFSSDTVFACAAPGAVLAILQNAKHNSGLFLALYNFYTISSCVRQ